MCLADFTLWWNANLDWNASLPDEENATTPILRVYSDRIASMCCLVNVLSLTHPNTATRLQWSQSLGRTFPVKKDSKSLSATAIIQCRVSSWTLLQDHLHRYFQGENQVCRQPVPRLVHGQQRSGWRCACLDQHCSYWWRRQHQSLVGQALFKSAHPPASEWNHSSMLQVICRAQRVPAGKPFLGWSS